MDPSRPLFQRQDFISSIYFCLSFSAPASPAGLPPSAGRAAAASQASEAGSPPSPAPANSRFIYLGAGGGGCWWRRRREFFFFKKTTFLCVFARGCSVLTRPSCLSRRSSKQDRVSRSGGDRAVSPVRISKQIESEFLSLIPSPRVDYTLVRG